MFLALADLARRVGAIGNRPEDTAAEKLEHSLLVYMGVLMSIGGLVWGSMAAYFELWIPAIIPYGYVVVTVLNLSAFSLTKNFSLARIVQVTASFLLPFIFQWSLGGFVDSGAVMLWAMLSIVGSLAFAGYRFSVVLLVAYCVLAIASGFLDATVREAFSPRPGAGAQTLYFVTNTVMISLIVFGLTIWLLEMRNRANARLEDAHARLRHMNEQLEETVAQRTRELRGALNQSRAILANMADGLVAVGPDGTVTAANPALVELFGIDSARPEALPEAVRDLANRSALSRSVLKEEIKLPGSRMGMAVGSPLHTEEGDSEGAVVLVRDITLEKQIDRMKTEFITTVSHELRTPLTSVLGFAHMTKEKIEESVVPHLDTSERRVGRDLRHIRGNIDIIISEGARLTALINDVLEISKMEAGQVEWRPSWIAPDELVAASVAAVAGLFEGGTIDLIVDVPAELPALRGDKDRLMQVLINLLSNAQKFTEEGSVTVRVDQRAHELRFEIEDTGPGIAHDDLEAVFDKFKQVGEHLTNKPTGTGLGLPICKQIVEAHGGYFDVHSVLGEGSTFAFCIPIAGRPSLRGPDALIRGVTHLLDEGLPSAGRDVLVVDDNANVRELLRQQLEARGLQVREAADGPQALDKARAHRPDLVILDVMMPSMSGFDVATVLTIPAPAACRSSSCRWSRTASAASVWAPRAT